MNLSFQPSSQPLYERWSEMLAQTLDTGLGWLGERLAPAWAKCSSVFESGVVGSSAIHGQLESLVGEKVAVHLPAGIGEKLPFVVATFAFAFVGAFILVGFGFGLKAFLFPYPEVALAGQPARQTAAAPRVVPPVAAPGPAIRVGLEAPLTTHAQIHELAHFNVFPDGPGRWVAKFETALTREPAHLHYVWNRHGRRWQLQASAEALRSLARGRRAQCWGLIHHGELNWHPEFTDPAVATDPCAFNAAVYVYINGKLSEFGLPLLNTTAR